MPNTINITPIDELVQVHEAIALAAITPGDLIENTNAANESIQRSSGAGSQFTGPRFALPNTAVGGDIDTDYAADETARYLFARAGDEVYAWLEDGLNVTRFTSYVIDNGANGTLKNAVGTETGRDLIGQALETVTASGKTRLKIRVL